jgi:hypothetical protein
MYHEFIEFLINGGVRENSILFALSIPIVAVIINFARYIIGIKSFSIYATLATIFLMFTIGATFMLDGSSIIINGIIYGVVLVLLILITTITIYRASKYLKLHYFPKITTIIIGVSISIVLMFVVAIKFENQFLIQLSPISVILLIVIAEQILEVYFKKQLSSTLITTVETLGISILSYIIIAQPLTKIILFQYPFIVLLLIIVNIGIGKYTGLRLTEINRFYELLIDQQNPKDEDIGDMEE